MAHKALPIIFAFVLVNAWTAVIFSIAYTAFSIRVRNRVFFALTRQRFFEERADHASDIAEAWLKWLRPIGFGLANLLVLFFAYQILTH